jgi:hypothetical protein
LVRWDQKVQLRHGGTWYSNPQGNTHLVDAVENLHEREVLLPASAVDACDVLATPRHPLMEDVERRATMLGDRSEARIAFASHCQGFD